MLSQLEIDTMVKNINEGLQQYIYYVAHLVETREGVIDEAQYKSVPKFKVIKVKVTRIVNAYTEVMNYYEHPDLYVTESEIEMYDADTEYEHVYVLPAAENSYNKPLNPRYPSIIYGSFGNMKDKDKSDIIKSYSTSSPVKPIYTNALEYAGLSDGYVRDEYSKGNLDWKYITLSTPTIVDGIEYKYITSDWYLIETENFPRTELPLIKVDEKCAYFMDPDDAFSFINECEA